MNMGRPAVERWGQRVRSVLRMGNSIRVLLLEDHAPTAEATAKDLEDSGYRVRLATTIAEAGRRQARCDVALVDMRVCGSSGAEFIGAAVIPCIALSAFRDAELVQAALSAGAIGYLTKDSDITEIAMAIERALCQKATLSSSVTTAVVAMVRKTPAHGGPINSRTPRETEILERFAEGDSYSEVALRFGLGLGTVQTHVKRMYSKLGVVSKAEACALAIRHGLLSL